MLIMGLLSVEIMNVPAPGNVSVLLLVLLVGAGRIGFAADQGARSTMSALLPVTDIAARRGLDLSIDPEILGELTDRRVMVRGDAQQVRLKEIIGQLEPSGFVIVPVQLTPNLRVDFLSKRATVVYCAAVGQLKRGNLAAAREALRGVPCDECEFSAHCLELREVLQALMMRNRAIARLELEARQSLNRLNVARSGVTTAAFSMGSGFRASYSVRRLGPDLSQSFAAVCRERLQAESAHANGALNQLWDEMVAGTGTLEQRTSKISAARLQSEGFYLMDQLAASLNRYETVRRMVRREAAGENPASAANAAAEISRMREELKKSTAKADCCVEAAIGALDGQRIEESLSRFAEAFHTDRANPLARIGFGYCLVKRYGFDLSPFCRELMPDADPASLQAAAVK